MARVPMLCYHRIAEPPPDRADDALFTTPALFTEHVEMLARLGFHGVTVADVARWQRGEQTLPKRPIVLTFDDGYECALDVVVPVLRARGWTATVYAVSAHVGGLNVWDPDAPPARLLNADGLRQLVREGFEVGSHTRHHRRVTELNAAEFGPELAGSRRDLEDILGRPVESFAFPYGTHTRAALVRVAEAGYTTAVTLKRWANGRRTSPLRMGRASVPGELAPSVLAAKVLKMLFTPAFA